MIILTSFEFFYLILTGLTVYYARRAVIIAMEIAARDKEKKETKKDEPSSSDE